MQALLEGKGPPAYATGHEQAAWINANLGKIWNYLAEPRLKELQTTVPDVGS
jgi:hypothetical protein